MNISSELKNKALEISNEFSQIHQEYKDLDKRLHELTVKRNGLFERLNKLRALEKDLINKIEEESGVKFTADIANDIIYEES
jgi:uncharacterized coiled-coil DUF342 family protein